MLAWFSFFMLLIGGLLYSFLSPDLRSADERNLPYARAAIMQLVSRHQGAVKLATLNLANIKVQLGLSDADFSTNEAYGKNLFTTSPVNTALVGILAPHKMAELMPSGLGKSFTEIRTLPLPDYHSYNSVFACLDDRGEITATCAQNKSYVLTYGYQQDWWDERAKKDNLWQKALAKETEGACGVLSCTSTSCQIKSGAKLTPFPNALYRLLVNDALVHTGGRYPLVGLTVCLTQVSVGPDKSTPPEYGNGTSDIGVECLKNEDCTEPGKTYCNPATFRCEALLEGTACTVVNPKKPHFIEGIGCVECLKDSDCPAATPNCDLNGGHQCVGCFSNAQCHTGMICSDGICITCPAGTHYKDATVGCVACLNNTHCATQGMVCTANMCVPCAEGTYYKDATAGCVSCTADSHCPEVCDTTQNMCTTCALKTPSTPHYNDIDGTCVACTENTHCPNATPYCVPTTHTCKVPETNEECQSVDPTKPIYDTPTGTCVECHSNSHCTNEKPICDTVAHTCRAGSGLPYPCEGDGDCSGTQVCQNGICTLSCRTQSDPDGYCHTLFGADWACDMSSSTTATLVGGYCQYCLYTYDGQIQDLRDIRFATSTGVTAQQFTTSGQVYNYWHNDTATAYKNACLVNVTTADTDCPSVRPDLCGDAYYWMPYGQLPAEINITDNRGVSTWRACTKTSATAGGRGGMFATTGTNPVYMTKVDGSGWLIHRDSVYNYPLGMAYYTLCTPACWHGTESAATPTCYKMTHTWGPAPTSTADCQNIAPSLVYDTATNKCVNATDPAAACRKAGKVYDEGTGICRVPEDDTDCAWIDPLKPTYTAGTCTDACATCADGVCDPTGQCVLNQEEITCDEAADCPAGYTCAGHMCSLYCYNKGNNKTNRDAYCHNMFGENWACDTNYVYGGYCVPCVVDYDGGAVNIRDFKFASSLDGSNGGVNANAGVTAGAIQTHFTDPNDKMNSPCLYGAYKVGVNTASNYNNSTYMTDRDTDCPVVHPGLCGTDHEWVPLKFLKTLNPAQDYGNDFTGFAARMRACTIRAAGGTSLVATSWTRVRQDYAYAKYISTNGLITNSGDITGNYYIMCMPACYKNEPDGNNTYCYKDLHTWGPVPTSHAMCQAADHTLPYYDGTKCIAPTDNAGCRAVDATKPYYIAGRGCVPCTSTTQSTDCTDPAKPVCDQMIYECVGCTNTYDADGIATGDTCPAGKYCRHDTIYEYNGESRSCDKRQPWPGVCQNIPAYDTAVINGETWVATRSTSNMRWWNAMSFCAKIGAKPVTRADICDGGTTTAECLNSPTWKELHRVFNTEAKAIYGSSSTARTYCWTKEDYPSYSCLAYYVHLSTGTVSASTRPNYYYALCKY